MVRESQFQAELIKELKARFPGCVVLKNDASYIQGFPDLLILFENTWAALECKAAPGSVRQPNQEYWVDTLDSMSFSAFIHPSNKEDVILALQRSFRAHR